MVFNTTGNDNTGVGYFTLHNNDTGNSNSAVGSDTLISNISGDCNVAIGESALLMNNTGDNNIAVGCDAGSEATTGSNNIISPTSGWLASLTLSESATGQSTQNRLWQGFPQVVWQRSCSNTTVASLCLALAAPWRSIRRRLLSAQRSARPMTQRLLSTPTVFIA